MSDISFANEQFVEQEVANGVYANRDAAINAGFELLRQRKEMLERIRKGREQLDNGEYEEYDMDSLRDYFSELKEQTRKQIEQQQNT